ELTLEQVAVRRPRQDLGGLTGVGQEGIFLADALPFTVRSLGLNFNFPEHRAPSWLGLTNPPAPPRPRFATQRGSGRAAPPVAQGRGPAPGGSGRRSPSRGTDPPRQCAWCPESHSP